MGKAEEDEGSGDEEDEGRVEESEDSTDAESEWRPDNTRILRILYQDNVAEATRQNEVARKSKVFNGKHGSYKNSWVTSLGQETASVHPRAGAVNVYDDSSDEEAYTGEQKEIAREVDELRVARHWINQEGSDAAAEARACSSATGQELDLHLDWSDVRR